MESERQIAQMERARILTRNFRAFQGYRLLPAVPVLLLWAGFEAGPLGLLTVNGIVSHLALDSMLGGRDVRPKAS